MKNIIAIVLAVSVLVPNFSYAATSVTTQNAALLQLMTSLLEQIKVLQAKLDAQNGKTRVTQVSMTDRTEYQKKVAPLLEHLDETDDVIELLEVKIEQKECNQYKWFYADGKRTFKCYDASGVAPKVSDEINGLKEDLESLEDEKEEIEEKIENLKTRYGI